MEETKTLTTTLGLFEESLDLDGNSKLVVYNDDINTFDHVIECLITICKISKELAEIKAFLIHTEGKAKILDGTSKDIKDMCYCLKMKGLKADIEKI